MMSPPPLARRHLGLVALVVAARFVLGCARFAAHPERFVNFEENYNATVSWLFTHGFARHLLALQYRDFCGGCTVDAVLGAPLVAADPLLWRWKLLPLAWGAATQVAGFVALRRLVGPAAGWGWLMLSLAPPLVALDLSLMAWGNHQESALFVAASLALVAGGRPAAGALLLGLGITACRTAAYALPALALAAWSASPGAGLRGMVAPFGALLLGLAPILIPAAGGDAGYYDMAAPVGDPAKLIDRLATLMAPRELGRRLWLPMRDMTLAAGAILASAAVAAVFLLRDRRGRVIVLLAGGYAAAYGLAQFPIFLVGARVPLNNVRYHAPWVFVLSLLTAAGAGFAWRAGRRGWAVGMVGAWLGSGAVGLARVRWTPDPRARTMSALDLPYVMASTVGRLDANRLGKPLDDPRADRARARMRGLALGADVQDGVIGVAEAVAAAGDDPAVLGGLGELLVEPCIGLDAAEAAVAVIPEPQRQRVRRGAARTLSFCQDVPRANGHLDMLLLPEWAPWSSGLGPTLVAACSGPARDPPEPFAQCLRDPMVRLPDRSEVLYGAGRAWARPDRGGDELAAIVAALGEDGAAFREGALDPGAGSQPVGRRGGD